MKPPINAAARAIRQEAAIEAALHDGHGWPAHDRSELFQAAMAEIMFLLAEMESPTPAATQERRVKAIEMIAEMMRAEWVA